ncbi:putative TIM-barrel fold metal-dependent hydrolase [Thioclava sp. ES.031]|uniref:amidohydrolase family protein n=1 Tax=Thioclava sp. ES.031 TaxID=1798203 RepID=UPI000BF87320|nr:amidohydrolase family protein [Thioclava sp. ES.031]PFG62252.1 putative TIM-barrel fold metal-dependent hydrolase [Thioclava sp. ES.031]
MQPNDILIDAHVHLYSDEDLSRVADALPYARPAAQSLTGYLDGLLRDGIVPTLINNVHLSILPDSENVFSSFAELKKLQARDPERYGKIRLVGTILADPGYATADRLNHPQVAGVRVVLHDAAPESVGPSDYATPDWTSLWARLRPDQHIHIYAQEPETSLRVLRQLPQGLRVVIDHLGNCRPARGAQDAAFKALLAEAAQRGTVWFKGPGYRTTTDPETTLPFLLEVLDALGPERVLLQASDAPHVGKDQTGRDYAAQFSPRGAFDYVARLAELAAQHTGISAERLLNGARHEIFPPHQ